MKTLQSNSVWATRFDWRSVLPPSRPSRRHIDLALRNIPRSASTVAILGSTPELLDAVAAKGIPNIVILEKYREAYRSMTELRSRRTREILVVGDWRATLHQRRWHGVFDAVLSDLTSGNLPYEDRSGFYAGVARSLSPRGVFIDKILCHGEGLPDYRSVINGYVNEPVNLATINRFNCELFFNSNLIRRDGIVNPAEIARAIGASTTEPVVRRLVDEVLRITPASGKWYYGRPWRQLRGDYFRSLKLVRAYDEVAGSPYSGVLRVIVTSRRGE